MSNDVSIRVRVLDLTRGGVGSARNSLTGLSKAMVGLGVGAVASQSLVGVAVAAQQLAGAALALPGALGAGTAIVGVFRLALTGLGDALSATSGGAASAGVNVAAAARQIRDANRQIEDAQRGVDEANRQLQASYRAVAAAERQVISAKRDVERASRDHGRALDDERDAYADIDQAREDAIDTLEELREAQDDSVRSVDTAALAVKRAEADLRKTMRDSRATALDRAEAADRVRQAEERLSDSQRQSQQSTEKLAEAEAKGVEGSDQVVAAKERAVDASDRAQDAAERLVDANERVTEAERGVEEANRGVEESRRRVDDATRSVEDAEENLNDTLAQQREAAAAAAAGVDAYAEALSKISPEARELVEVLRGLEDEWRGVQFAVQDAMFEGAAEDVQELAGVYLPLLRDGLAGIAAEINDMGSLAVDQLLDPESVENINAILANTTGFLDNAEGSLADFIAGLLELAAIGSEYLPEFGTWVSDIARDFREWTELNPDGIRDLIEGGVEALGDLWEIGGNVLDMFGAIFGGLGTGDGGEGFLQMLVDMTQGMADFAGSEGTQEVLRILGEVSRLLIETIPIWGPVAAGMFGVAQAMKLVNLVMRANPIGLIITGLTLLVSAFMYAWNNSETFRTVLTNVWNAIVGAFVWARDTIVGGWNWLMGALSDGAGWIQRTLSGMWDGLTNGLKAAVNGAIWLLNGLISGVNDIIWGMNVVNPFSDIPYIPYVPYLARGGIVGANGMAVVGEQGPELVQLGAGAQVHSNGKSERMLAGGGGAQTVVLELRSSGSAVDEFLMEMLRRSIRVEGGDVQAVLGSR